MTTVAAFAGAYRDARRSWRPRASAAAAVFAVAALAPLVVGDARLADLAGGLYLAVAATGLAFAVGLGGLPSLAQGAFMAVGAVVGARLLQAGAPTPVAAPAGAAAATLAGAVVGVAFARLPRAGLAAATWIVAWLVSFALQALPWFLGGTEGIVVTAGPGPAGHYELALALTALAALGYVALGRAPLGLGLAAARDRAAAVSAYGLPVRRLRVTALAVSAAPAGLAGALAVELAAVGDPSQYGPYLSFKLFVVVLLGGALAPLGALAGVVVLGVLSVAADAIGTLEDVAHARSHALLAAIMLLGVVSLGWEGIVPAARRRWSDAGGAGQRPDGRGLVARGLRKEYGAVVAADGVSLALQPGTVTALVGPNGSGKTTVLRLLSGSVNADEGSIEGGTVARTLQATAVFPTLTPLEHLLAASALRRRHGGVVRSLLATPKARAEEARFAGAAQATLERFALPPDVPAGELPVSDQRILMFLTAAATGATTLLVDEPTAGASAREADRIAAVIGALRADGHALLVVEHNLRVVRRLADRVLELDGGRVVETRA
ncbi:MAG TPA: ATP-binding cassette domain-containing protein [Gaiellaceae bacterium]|nr:ATP-binding cassette domain-containing protein [Gaiellaceae bacterium]